MPDDSKDALRAAVRSAQQRYESEAEIARRARRKAFADAAFLDGAVAVTKTWAPGQRQGNTTYGKTRRSTVCLGAASGRLEPNDDQPQTPVINDADL